MYGALLQEPYSFSLDFIASLTDDQVLGLFSKERGKRRRRDRAPQQSNLPPQEDLIQTVMKATNRSREETEQILSQTFPNHIGGTNG